MGSIKKEFVFVSESLQAGVPVRVKLDGWRCTLLLSGDLTGIRIDGSDAAPLTWQVTDNTKRNYNVWSVRMGGLVLNGEPVLMDDYLEIEPDLSWGFPEGESFSIVVVKEYYVAGRPGPDKLLQDAVPRAIPRRVNRPTDTRGPRVDGRNRYRDSRPPGKVQR